MENKSWMPSADEGNAFVAEQIEVRCPRRGTVVDKRGEKIGKIRKRVLYNLDDEQQGTFRKEDRGVYLYANEARVAYLDKNRNILTPSNEYIGTIRRFNPVLLWLLILLLGLATIISTLTCAYYMTQSGGKDDIPTIFVATEGGEGWQDTEDLPIFLNDTFGDRIVVPGMKGSYRFIFENLGPDTLEYSLTFSEENFYGIDICYRLIRDGDYVSGEEGYVSYSELGVYELTIEGNSSSLFELEWYWRDNDPVDTAAGENEAIYRLHIDLLAQLYVKEEA